MFDMDRHFLSVRDRYRRMRADRPPPQQARCDCPVVKAVRIPETSVKSAEPDGWKPEHKVIARELGTLREKGLTKLRSLALPELSRVSRLVVDDERADEVVAIEATLRQAVERLGGGSYGEGTGLLFGLVGGARNLGPRERREKAADELGMSAETLRTAHQKSIVSDVATQVLALVADQRRREARTQLERRHPAESRLAVEWVERFEAYYRLWTPAYALAADLTAYRSTLLEADRPYDRAPGTSGPDDPGYTQEEQAEGYARFALYRYATFELILHQFMTRYGGLWLLSSHAAEKTVEDSIYRIAWHISPFNERDQSWLRSAAHDTRNQGAHGFLSVVANTETGQARHVEWQQWVATCGCTWPLDEAPEEEYFPTSQSRTGIDSACQMHQVVSACENYCRTIEDEWSRIADWYHIGDKARPESPESLYGEWRGVGSPSEQIVWERGQTSPEWRAGIHD